MSMNLEPNKLFAAVLVAGIAALSAGLISEQVVKPHIPTEDAFKVEVTETADAGAAATAAPAVAEPIDELMATADIAQGEKLAKVCAACHTFDKGGANRVGPNMWGIVGAKHAHIEGFAYSDALKAKSAEPWDVAALNQFLWNPKKAIPGTKMGYAGMKKPEDRAALIKWLETLK
jgi:cytochrome c